MCLVFLYIFDTNGNVEDNPLEWADYNACKNKDFYDLSVMGSLIGYILIKLYVKIWDTHIRVFF